MPESKSAGQYIPLGSIGSGCVGVDSRGNFYNDILHPLGQGPLMPNSFPVIRASYGKGELYVRALRVAPANAPKLAHAPKALTEDEYRQQTAYPIVSCQLRDNNAPLRAAWTYFSTLAPYDHVASVMPSILMGVRVANPTTHPITCSVMFCMDNLATELSEDETPVPAQIHFIRVEPTANDNRSHLGTSLFRGAIADAPVELLSSYIRNAVLFGDRRNTGATALPHFCLGAKEQIESTVSHGLWDPESPSSCEFFWGTFREKGVAAAPPRDMVARAGAISSMAQIAPGAAYRFDFLFTWHVPPKICEAMGIANGYMQHFPNAPESVRYGLRHLSYLHTAVSNWQKQLTGSGLPEYFTGALIDSSRAFATHTRHTKKNGFVLATYNHNDESPENDWDFLKAFAMLSFMPRFHAAAVTTSLAPVHEESKNALKINEAGFLRRSAEIILSAYADVLYTGNRARFRDWYPRINNMLDSGIQGLLEKSVAEESVLRLNAETTGLWAAAMTAYAVMAREQGEDVAIRKREPLRRALAATYESQLLQLAQTGDQTTEQHIKALAGACYAELLNMRGLANAQYVYASLPESLADIAFGGMEHEQSHKVRMIAAIATLLFSRQEVGNVAEKGKLESFLAEVVEQNPDAGNALAPRTIASNNLDLWAVLQAITGVYFDSLHHSLIIKPSALTGMGTPLPVFTPVSLGKMDVQIEKGQDIILIVRIALETPLTVQSVALQLPVTMHSVRAACVHETETLTASQELLPGDGCTRIALRFRAPLKLTGMLTLRLRESTSQPNR